MVLARSLGLVGRAVCGILIPAIAGSIEGGDNQQLGLSMAWSFVDGSGSAAQG
jgi:hypothetical protein